jgi:hypothetical protein
VTVTGHGSSAETIPAPEIARIATVPRRGYRFVAAVHAVAKDAQLPPPSGEGARGMGKGRDPRRIPVMLAAAALRVALRGAALYRLSWFDAHLWAYADERGLDTIGSEDFQRGRLYRRVKVLNPFL